MKEMGKPSRVLTYEDAIEVWLMRWDGWLQSRIAAHFDVNQGRISEVLNGMRHFGSAADAAERRDKAA
ncbi:MAG: hypothetical protein CVT79_02705 [Alphaproteobacteria bacterium HGW-Alphaproteobacteria-18]|nr:MAG: hypothetical protein CVT79_02705 [Alphaproteobacteria bacterium HGW-Alphaproteobacteria-18]